MAKIETRITYNMRPIRRLTTNDRHGVTLNGKHTLLPGTTSDPIEVSFLGLDVYCYDDDKHFYLDELIFVDCEGNVEGTLNIDCREGIDCLNFQTTT